ncbi:MAG: SDR family NAD(P)-dependent oxidoreductase, partial [Cyclobacteriaceae bacterium]|nr:SDR family NAD(P)-dependent oxidoreductase [Cyclobacteriaceae bacterium]
MRRSILVTGGTRGIGRAIVEKFAEQGFDIFTCARNGEDLDSLGRFLEERFPKILVNTFVADLSVKEEVL